MMSTQTKELICHTDCFMQGPEYEEGEPTKVLSFGVVYEVVHDGEFAYSIIDDIGSEHYFTKEPDEYGTCYSDWLNVLQEDEEEEEEE